MASENSNIKSLAEDSSESDTGELEILSIDLIPTDEELEMDADTCSLDNEPTQSGSVESLRSDLQSRDERISSLQFDIELLRSRWSGLEKEIEAREELTSMLQADLKTAQEALDEKELQTEALERRIATLTDDLESVQLERSSGDDALATLERQIDELSDQRSQDAELIRSLESKLEAATESDAGTDRTSAHDTSAHDDSGFEAKYLARGEELEALKDQVKGLEDTLRDADTRSGQADAELSDARAENARLTAMLDEAKAKLSVAEAGEQQELEDQLALHRGQIADYGERLRSYSTRVENAERYGDDVRRKLEEAHSRRLDAEASLADTERDLTATRSALADLEIEFDAAKTTVSELEEQVAAQQSGFDDELSELRSEVERANDMVDTQAAANQELAATLATSESDQRELTAELHALKAERKTRDRSLKRKYRLLEQALAEAEKTISNKENAITALLNELASKSRSIDSIGEIESVVQELDGRMSERIDEDDPERERPTRVLTGSVDDQELRFPLFKDRLTIGRSNQNDIQLRAQYISRRHAVLMVDDDVTRIVDWGSKNGIYVNNARVSDQALNSGDRISIGAAEFVYEERPRRDLT